MLIVLYIFILIKRKFSNKVFVFLTVYIGFFFLNCFKKVTLSVDILLFKVSTLNDWLQVT